MNVYVASSWRNGHQPAVVQALRRAGYDVYDFRHPEPGDDGFHWFEIDHEWKSWTPVAYRNAVLEHPLAIASFDKDMGALQDADAVVLVTPCGPSAHLELGWALGAGKLGVILYYDTPHVRYEGAGITLTQRAEPELMYRMAQRICVSIDEVVHLLRRAEATHPERSA